MRRLAGKGLLASLLCWSVFLVMARRAAPHLGPAIGDAMFGSSAYGFLFRAPGMVFAPSLHAVGRDWPLVYSPYQGPWIIYELMPFVAALGCSLFTLRAFTAAMFFLVLWGVWRLAKAAGASDAAAFLSTLMLALCPTMAVFCDFYVGSSPAVAAAVWSLCFGASFVRGRKPAHGWLSAAALFLAFGSISWTAGLGAGLLLCLAAAPRRWLSLIPDDRGRRWRLAAGCVIGAVFFLLPIFLYNAASGGESVRYLGAHLLRRDPAHCLDGFGDCSNLHYARNLRGSWRALAALGDGGDHCLGTSPWHLAYAALLLASLLAALRKAWRERSLWSAPCMLWLAAAGYLLSSAISPTDQFAVHLMALAPVLAVLALLGLDGGPRWMRAFALAAAAWLCLAQSAGDWRFLTREHLDLSEQGYAQESPLLAQACSWAAERPKRPVASLSLAFAVAAPFLSQGRIPLLPYFPARRADWERWLRLEKRPLFLAEPGPAMAELQAAAKSARLEPVPVEVVADRLGRPAFEFLELRGRGLRPHASTARL